MGRGRGADGGKGRPWEQRPRVGAGLSVWKGPDRETLCHFRLYSGVAFSPKNSSLGGDPGFKRERGKS